MSHFWNHKKSLKRAGSEHSLLGESYKKFKTNENATNNNGEPLNFNERSQLAEDIHGLPSNKLAKVIEIIRYFEPQTVNFANPNEIEIDFTKLNMETIKALKYYCESCLPSVPKYPCHL